MGHAIQAFITAGTREQRALLDAAGAPIVRLSGLVLVPATDELFDHLRGGGEPPEQGTLEPFWKLSPGLARFAESLSMHSPVAYVETDYLGGPGDQAAAVWSRGALVMPPRRAEGGPINEALRLLGVERAGHHDEFDALGLGRHRSLESWLEEAENISADDE